MGKFCERNIKSRRKLVSFLLNKKNKESLGLRVHNKKSLKIDDEDRLYCKKWEQENCIIEINEKQCEKNTFIQKLRDFSFFNNDNQFLKHFSGIRFTRTRNISLKNVIIWGDVAISDSSFDQDEIIAGLEINIRLEHCFIFGKLNINVGAVKANLYGQATAIDEVILNNSKFGGVKFNNVSLGRLLMDECTIDELSLFESAVDSFQMRKSFFEQISFYGSQFNIKHSFLYPSHYKWKFFPKENRFFKKELYNQTAIDTAFVLKENVANFSLKDLCELEYQRGKIGKNILFCYMYRLFGGMVKPFFIFTWFIVVLVFFGIIYYSYPGSFGVTNYCYFSELKKFLYSLYFSTITITTVGYGDMHPNEDIMLPAAIEGVCGIFFGSAFLISLTRKYFKEL
jgi:hypothetical protein